MKVTYELDTNNSEDLKLIELMSAVIAADQAKPAEVPSPGVSKQEKLEVKIEDPENEMAEKLTEMESTSPPDSSSQTQQGSEGCEAESPDLDADGVGWDPNLHASTKSKTQDGRWKKRRGAKQPDAGAKQPDPETVRQAPELPEVSEASYVKSVSEHINKFGIDHTRTIIKKAVGDVHPRDVKPEDRGSVVAALQADKGPDTSFDNILEDF